MISVGMKSLTEVTIKCRVRFENYYSGSKNAVIFPTMFNNGCFVGFLMSNIKFVDGLNGNIANKLTAVSLSCVRQTTLATNAVDSPRI